MWTNVTEFTPVLDELRDFEVWQLRLWLSMFRLHQVIYENPQHVPNNVDTTTIFLSSLNYERLLINPHSFKHHKNNQVINNPT